jgi:hypothetical protein
VLKRPLGTPELRIHFLLGQVVVGSQISLVAHLVRLKMELTVGRWVLPRWGDRGLFLSYLVLSMAKVQIVTNPSLPLISL